MKTMDVVVGALRAEPADTAHPSHAAAATQRVLLLLPDKALIIRVEYEARC